MTKEWELPQILFDPLYFSSLTNDIGDLLIHILLEFLQYLAYLASLLGILLQLDCIKEGEQYP